MTVFELLLERRASFHVGFVFSPQGYFHPLNHIRRGRYKLGELFEKLLFGRFLTHICFLVTGFEMIAVAIPVFSLGFPCNSAATFGAAHRAFEYWIMFGVLGCSLALHTLLYTLE